MKLRLVAALCMLACVYSCAPGSTPLQNGTCITCVAGTSKASTGNASCVSCSKGQYSHTGASICIDCLEGSHSANTGSAECVHCSAGTYADTTGAVKCTACASGFYNAGVGATVCDECGVGNSTNWGNKICEPCAPGTFNAYNHSYRCFPCDTDYYQDVKGAKSCVKCPTGKVSNTQNTLCVDKPTTCEGTQDMPDKTEKELLKTRSSFTTNAERTTSDDLFASFVTHYLKMKLPSATCKTLYDKVLARMKSDSNNNTATRSHQSHCVLAAAVAVFIANANTLT